MLYFITTKTPNMTVEGQLPLSADEALTFIEQARGSTLVVEVRDSDDRLISEDELRKKAGVRRP